ncbi:hypothetical protein [Deinococcus planocerae]|uniref:hypothetical protein n=1 Tax=Deinococcus planocerae TaxID=1737569 RepID=UPI0015E08228|nr:hypothetical protein [Deinococcus planocerae]
MRYTSVLKLAGSNVLTQAAGLGGVHFVAPLRLSVPLEQVGQACRAVKPNEAGRVGQPW